jgi:hypothetical protein
MRDGICSKCQSKEVYVADKGNSMGNNATTEPLYIHIYKDKSFLPDVTVVETKVYICQSCGYIEHYSRNLNPLQKLSDSTNWRKVK